MYANQRALLARSVFAQVEAKVYKIVDCLIVSSL
jgi:hypothetical protein